MGSALGYACQERHPSECTQIRTRFCGSPGLQCVMSEVRLSVLPAPILHITPGALRGIYLLYHL